MLRACRSRLLGFGVCRRGGKLESALLLALLCGGLVSCEQAAEPAPPNVLLISLDTLRADRLSCYGNAHATSPAIDALAADGVLFERAVSTSSWTLPAHISMLTGLPVSAHGICHASPNSIAVAQRGEFLSESLGRAGYATAGFFTVLFLESQFGFGSGFDTWEHASDNTARARELRKSWKAASARGDQQEMDRISAESSTLAFGAPEAEGCVDRALEWLDQQQQADSDRPFFLFVHLFDIHDPYQPPAPYDTRFDPDYDGDIRTGTIRGPNATLKRSMKPRELEHIMALYDGEIAWVDSQVARVLERLDDLGVADNTLVVLTSDHGEEFLEHGRRGHHATLYRESVNVPLIMRFPAVLPAGVRLDSVVSIIDIVPTVQSIVGVSAAHDLSGMDLTRLLRGTQPDEPRVVVSELMLNGHNPPEWLVSLYRGDEHFIVEHAGTPNPQARRFDLKSNWQGDGEGEVVDWNSPQGQELQEQLEQLRKRTADLRGDLRQHEDASLDLLDEDIEHLNALGYSGVGDEPDAKETSRLCMDGCVWFDVTGSDESPGKSDSEE